MIARILVGVGIACAAASPAMAAPMSVETFVTKADALKKKGAMAMFSGDLKLLMNQVKADSASPRAENDALARAGKPKHYCTPDKFTMGQDDIMGAMNAVPAAQRSATSTKLALRAYIARRHPCRG